MTQTGQFKKYKNLIFGKRLPMNSIAKCLKTKRKNYARKKKNHLMTVQEIGFEYQCTLAYTRSKDPWGTDDLGKFQSIFTSNLTKAHLMMLFKQNFPSMIPLPKQKEIISNIEQMLSDARIEKFGDRGNSQGMVPLVRLLIWLISYESYGYTDINIVYKSI